MRPALYVFKTHPKPDAICTEAARLLNNCIVSPTVIAALKYEYFLSNGLISNPSPDELFFIAENKEQDAWEIERLLHAISLRDPALILKVRKNHESLKV